jgi:hypothetical protein
MVPSLGGEDWPNRMDRLGRAIWELFHAHPEIGYVRAEVYVADDDSSPEVLATDVAGGCCGSTSRTRATTGKSSFRTADSPGTRLSLSY